MDLEDKLKLLKKEKENRTRAQKIQDAWEKISQEEELSVKEKLERLITLTKREKKEEKRQIPEESEPRKISSRESLLYFENSFSLDIKYGKIPLFLGLEVNGEALYWLSRESELRRCDLSSAVFLDLETTGLSGGTGVVPFLIGFGYYQGDRFVVSQFFLGDLAEEEKLIAELCQFLAQKNFQSLVTYNGKGFDIPIIETRFTLHRQLPILSSLPHLDFLFSARCLWKHKHESCRLYHLARQVVRADRSEDIPSEEIPYRYFQYLRTGDFSLIEPILYHNQEDILSLLSLVITASFYFSEKREEWAEEDIDAMDYFGLAKLFENAGELEKSTFYYTRALEDNLAGELALRTKKKLSYFFKKNHDWEKAVGLWQELTSEEQLFCFRELAMYYEHKKRDYERAKKIAEEGLTLSLGISATYERDFLHRLERLGEKIRRQQQRLGEK